MNNQKLLLATQKSLLGKITSNLRAIYLTHLNDFDKLIFYYNEPPYKIERELANTAHTELVNNLPSIEQHIELSLEVIPSDEKILGMGICLYHRCELPLLKEVEDEVSIVDLIIATNKALHGEIRPKMRKVFIRHDPEKASVSLYIYFDESLTKEEKENNISGNIIKKLQLALPKIPKISLNAHDIVSPYPSKISNKGTCIYRRYEFYPEDEYEHRT